MSNFISSTANGKYSSGVPYTSFHKQNQDSDKLIGLSYQKASFWRSTTYILMLFNILYIFIFLFVFFSPAAPLKVIEVSNKGDVLFWGDLKTPPEILPKNYKSNYIKTMTNSDWQKIIDKKIIDKKIIDKKIIDKVD